MKLNTARCPSMAQRVVFSSCMDRLISVLSGCCKYASGIWWGIFASLGRFCKGKYPTAVPHGNAGRILPAIIVAILVASAGMAGIIAGFYAASCNPIPPGTIVLKAAYAVDRYASISLPPEAFRERWSQRIKAFTRDKSIACYMGEGSNATPILPLQLEKLGFDVVRFGKDELEAIRGCSVIIFPGGRYSLDWNDEQVRILQGYVRGGSGYIGICFGVVAAQRLGLFDAALRPCPVTGLIDCVVEPSFFRGSGSPSQLTFLHMNGRIISRGDIRPLVMWGDHVMGGTRDYDKGRVVLFSSHPEGGKIEFENRYILAEGTTLRTMDLLLDAIFYAAREGEMP